MSQRRTARTHPRRARRRSVITRRLMVARVGMRIAQVIREALRRPACPPAVDCSLLDRLVAARAIELYGPGTTVRREESVARDGRLRYTVTPPPKYTVTPPPKPLVIHIEVGGA